MAVDNNHSLKLGQLKTFAIEGVLPIKQNLDTHTSSVVASESGTHGIRYYNDSLEVFADEYEIVTPESEDNPSEEGWYEIENDEYVLTEDETVTSGKIYYELTSDWNEISVAKEKIKVKIPNYYDYNYVVYNGDGLYTCPIKDFDPQYMIANTGPRVQNNPQQYMTVDGLTVNVPRDYMTTDYITTISLKDRETMAWNDETSSNKTYYWHIVRGENVINISQSSVQLDEEHQTCTVNLTTKLPSYKRINSDNNALATAQYNGVTGILTISIANDALDNNSSGTTKIQITALSSDYAKQAKCEIDVTVSLHPIYGVYWDGTSATTWTRTDNATNFDDPVPAVNNGDGSSPFDNCMPWSGMQRIQHNDCGTLVKIPKYYYKWTREEGTMKLQISDYPKQGFLVSPAHADRGDGEGERDFVYVGAYHCSTSDYTSSPSVKPKTSITRASFRQNIHNLGTDVWQWDFAMVWTIWMLYLVEYANWDSQEAIGFGCGAGGSSAENNGLCDEMIYHTGTNKATASTYGHVRYRWIEDLWANTYDFCDGIYFDNAEIYGIANPADFSDTDGGVLVGERVTSTNNIKAWTNPTELGFEYMLFPSEVISNSSYNSFSCDSHTYSSSGKVLRIGHYYSTSSGRKAGMFEILSDLAANGSNSYTGSRLQKLPSSSSL